MAPRSRKSSRPFDLGAILLTAREPVFWVDSALCVAWVNAAWEEMTGRSLEYIRGTFCPDQIGTFSEDPADLAASFRPPAEVVDGKPASVLTVIYRSSGEAIHRRLEFFPWVDSAGVRLGYLGLVRPADVAALEPDSAIAAARVALLGVRRHLRERYGMESLIGEGPAHDRLVEQVRLAAGSQAPVLILGERGAGKKHAARVIHQLGPNREQPIVPCDCEALPPEILERELFGLASTVNSPSSPGARARLSLNPGSAFLIQEIWRLPRELQARLAGTLQGPVRVLATSSIDPEAAAAAGQIVPELHYKLTVLVLRIEPLRRRRSEIPLLAQHFLEQANLRGAPFHPGFTDEATALLTSYDWPGNLRELARVVEEARMRAPADARLIDAPALPANLRNHIESSIPTTRIPAPPRPLDEILLEVERRLIESALDQARGNKSRAAELLGISRPRLYRRALELGLVEPDPNAPRPAADLPARHNEGSETEEEEPA